MESYPRQCKTSTGETFAEEVGNELEKRDLIQVHNPRPNQRVTSPLEVSGIARGYWFFEASFPIRLLDARGREIAVAIAQAKSEWMTEDFVPFEATLIFDASEQPGTLIFEKDNPSGLPEHDDYLSMPVMLGGNEEVVFCTQDAKQCPDGSYVGREGPRCEFKKCPGESDPSGWGGISGTVTRGPICPVEQFPPQEECADKPYATKFYITTTNGVETVADIESDDNGVFQISLPTGEYTILPKASAQALPRCESIGVNVTSGVYSEVTISCDTGIR